jgi:RNA polymerase sigma-70 factor (ECF subfamily)
VTFQRTLAARDTPRTSEPEPAEAARDAAEDSKAALERACEAEHSRVYGYIRCRVDSRDTADDLTAQAFTKALARHATFDPSRASLGAWILAIARNVVRDHLRKRRRWRWLPLEGLGDRPTPDPTPESAVLLDEERRRLLEAMETLPERHRDILALKFAGGLTNGEIARATGLRPGHVGVIVYRALGRLRDRLGGKEVHRA